MTHTKPTLEQQLVNLGDELAALYQEGRMNSLEFSDKHARYMRICRQLTARENSRTA